MLLSISLYWLAYVHWGVRNGQVLVLAGVQYGHLLSQKSEDEDYYKA